MRVYSNLLVFFFALTYSLTTIAGSHVILTIDRLAAVVLQTITIAIHSLAAQIAYARFSFLLREVLANI